MESGSLLFSFFLIFTGAAVLATGALIHPSTSCWLPISPLVPYWVLLVWRVVNDTNLLNDIAHVGIIFSTVSSWAGYAAKLILRHLLRKRTATVGLASSFDLCLNWLWTRPVIWPAPE